MNKKMFFFIIGCVIALAAVYLLFFKEQKGTYAQNDTPIPSDYQAYHNIRPAFSSDTFEIVEVCKATVSGAAVPSPIRAYKSVGDHIIINCNAQKDEDSKGDAIYFKINKMGDVSDSIYVKYTGYWTVLIADFMVHTQHTDAYYTTWPADGDTTRRAFVVHNADFQLNTTELSHKRDAAIKESAYYFVRTYASDQRYMTATYYYADNQWQVIWQETASYQSEADSESAARYQQVIYRSGDHETYLHPDVALQHFHPQDSIMYYHIIGGGTPGIAKIDWRGTGFFETTIDSILFHFSIANLVIEKEKYDGYQTRLYQVDQPKSRVKHVNTTFYHSPFGFALYASPPQVLYIIRKKTR